MVFILPDSIIIWLFFSILTARGGLGVAGVGEGVESSEFSLFISRFNIWCPRHIRHGLSDCHLEKAIKKCQVIAGTVGVSAGFLSRRSK